MMQVSFAQGLIEQIRKRRVPLIGSGEARTSIVFRAWIDRSPEK